MLELFKSVFRSRSAPVWSGATRRGAQWMAQLAKLALRWSAFSLGSQLVWIVVRKWHYPLAPSPNVRRTTGYDSRQGSLWVATRLLLYWCSHPAIIAPTHSIVCQNVKKWAKKWIWEVDFSWFFYNFWVCKMEIEWFRKINWSSSNFETFKASLERGQTQPATILKNSVKVDLVYEGMKYCVRATQTGKSNYMMELGHSKKDVEACICIII